MSNKVFDFDLMADELIPQNKEEDESIEKRTGKERRSGMDRRQSVRLQADRRTGHDRRAAAKDLWADNFLE